MIQNKEYPVEFNFWDTLPSNNPYEPYWWEIDSKQNQRIENKQLEDNFWNTLPTNDPYGVYWWR